MSSTLFLIEGDYELVKQVADLLGKRGYSLEEAADKEIAQQIATSDESSFIIVRHSFRAAEIYDFGEMQIDFGKSRIVRSGKTMSLSERENQILRYLVENHGQVVSRDAILKAIWGYRWAPLVRTVDVHVLRLRQKIEIDPRLPRFLVTVHGRGYQFDSPTQ